MYIRRDRLYSVRYKTQAAKAQRENSTMTKKTEKPEPEILKVIHEVQEDTDTQDDWETRTLFALGNVPEANRHIYAFRS